MMSRLWFLGVVTVTALVLSGCNQSPGVATESEAEASMAETMAADPAASVDTEAGAVPTEP